MSGLRINTGSTNKTIINPSVTPKFKFEGKFNYPVILLGSNNYDGGVYSLDGGRHWLTIDTLGYDTEQTLLNANAVSSYLNMSPNLLDVCMWSWTQSGSLGGCLKHLSHDAGRTWTTTYYDNAKYQYTHYNYNNNTIYLGGWQGGGLKSTDAGDSFTSLPMLNGIQPLVYDSSDDENYIYAGMTQTKSIQYSTNQGSSWTSISVSTDGSNNARIVKCDGTGQYVFAYYGNYSILLDFSDDYGQTYTPLSNSVNSRGEMKRDGSCFTYISTSTSRIYFSTDQGSSWTYITSPFGNNISQVYRQDYTNNEIYITCREYPQIYKVNSTGDGLELIKTLNDNVWIFGPSQYGRGYLYTASDSGLEGDVYFSRNSQSWELIREKDSTAIGRSPTIL